MNGCDCRNNAYILNDDTGIISPWASNCDMCVCDVGALCHIIPYLAVLSHLNMDGSDL